MTTSDGDLPVGETVDIETALQEVTADDAPGTADAEPVADDAEPAADEAPEAAAAPEEPAEPEEVDPAAALKADLRAKPGDWYVIHSYAGYENKVKANLETRVQNLDVGDYIFQVEVPTEEVTEIKNGQRKQVNRKVLPGYILVRMDLTDDSWCAVRNTPGVTGFVGADVSPVGAEARRRGEVPAPQGAAKKPAKGAASTATAVSEGGLNVPWSRSTTRSVSRSPSWTVRSPRCRRRSTRSTSSNRKLKVLVSSSVAKLRSNWASARSRRS